MRKSLVPAILVSGTLISNAALFMAISVLALFLSERGLSLSEVGVVIGAIALVASVLGFFGGRLSKSISEPMAVAAGTSLSGVAHLAMSRGRTFPVFLLLALTIGFARSISEPAMKSLMGNNPAPGHPDLVFRLRYLSICAGAIVGPLGALLFGSKELAISATGVILIVYGLTMIFVARRWIPPVPRTDSLGERGPAAALRDPALVDPRLLILIAAGGAVFVVFSLFESIVPLALASSFTDASSRFPVLLIVNAALGAALQIPATFLSKFLSTRTLAVAGCIFFAFAFALFSVAEARFQLWVLAVLVFTTGEALALPAGEILIDRVAPAGHKASYFGLAEMRQLGFFIGPAAGGFVLGGAGQFVVFLASAIAILGAGALYSWSGRLMSR